MKKDDITILKLLWEKTMDSFLNWIEAHIGKMVGIPLSLNAIQFIMTLMHAMSDGVIDHTELETLLQAGNGSCMVLLALAMAYLKFKKKS